MTVSAPLAMMLAGAVVLTSCSSEAVASCQIDAPMRVTADVSAMTQVMAEVCLNESCSASDDGVSNVSSHFTDQMPAAFWVEVVSESGERRRVGEWNTSACVFADGVRQVVLTATDDSFRVQTR